MEIIFTITCLLFSSIVFLSAYGDGLASETLPPAIIGNRNVTLSINSSPFLIDNNHTGTQINFILLDVASQQPIPDATLAVSAFRGDKALFGHIFQSDNGNFLISIIPNKSDKVSVDEEGGIFSGVLGQHSGNYKVQGPIFDSGGLYRFKINVLTMGLYSNEISKNYEVAISIQETKDYQVFDKEYGNQTVTIIAYYDQIRNFHYETEKKTMNFVMPFTWTEDTIKQVSVVHQEIKIPKSFGDYIVTKYDVYVNGINLPDKAISIDDYSSDERIVHLILYRPEIADIAKKQGISKPEMDFLLSPSNETGFPITQFTRNAQYKVSLSWDPPKILPGSTTKFTFQVLDPYLINKTIDSPVSYDLSIIEGRNNVIFHKSGITDSSGGGSIDVPFPSNYTGPSTIAFENMHGNSFAGIDFSSVVDRYTVPEFPLGSLLVMIILFSFIILIPKFMKR